MPPAIAARHACLEIPFEDRFRRCADLGDDGCLLVRPDRHIAFRAMTDAAEASGQLGAALEQILCRAA